METKQIIKHPLATEKTIRMMESENKLIFEVDRSARKNEIKEALEKMFKIKVVKVNTQITSKGHKRAYVKLSDDTPAIDLATQLGLI